MIGVAEALENQLGELYGGRWSLSDIIVDDEDEFSFAMTSGMADVRQLCLRMARNSDIQTLAALRPRQTEANELYEWALRLFREGHNADATHEIARSIQIYPYSASSFGLQGFILGAQGRLVEAGNSFQDASTYAPPSQPAVKYRWALCAAEAYTQAGYAHNAWDVLTTTHNELVDEHGDCGEVLMAMARANAAIGRPYDEQVELLTRALRTDLTLIVGADGRELYGLDAAASVIWEESVSARRDAEHGSLLAAQREIPAGTAGNSVELWTGSASASYVLTNYVVNERPAMAAEARRLMARADATVGDYQARPIIGLGRTIDTPWVRATAAFWVLVIGAVIAWRTHKAIDPNVHLLHFQRTARCAAQFSQSRGNCRTQEIHSAMYNLATYFCVALAVYLVLRSIYRGVIDRLRHAHEQRTGLAEFNRRENHTHQLGTLAASLRSITQPLPTRGIRLRK